MTSQSWNIMAQVYIFVQWTVVSLVIIAYFIFLYIMRIFRHLGLHITLLLAGCSWCEKSRCAGDERDLKFIDLCAYFCRWSHSAKPCRESMWLWLPNRGISWHKYISLFSELLLVWWLLHTLYSYIFCAFLDICGIAYYIISSWLFLMWEKWMSWCWQRFTVHWLMCLIL